MGRLRHSRLGLAALVAAVVLVAVSVPTALALLDDDGDPVANEHAGQTTTAVDHSAHPVAGNFKPNETVLEDCEGGDRACLEQATATSPTRKGRRPRSTASTRRSSASPRSRPAVTGSSTRSARRRSPASRGTSPRRSRPAGPPAGPATTTASSSGRSSRSRTATTRGPSRASSATTRTSRATRSSTTSASTGSGTAS